jgi:hypothetical protein
MRNILLFCLLLLWLGFASSTLADATSVKFLQSKITPDNFETLGGLEPGEIVLLDLAIDWPANRLDRETSDLKRLVFWNDEYEFLFPFGSYSDKNGMYYISGYFKIMYGGRHQGITSVAFEPASKADASASVTP